MKRKIMLLTIGLICGILFTACQDDTTKNKKLSISVVAGSMSENTPAGIGVKTLAEKLVEYSNGEIQATPYFDTQLGDAKSMVQGLQNGTIDIGVAGNSYFSSIVPEVQVLELPYIFENYDQARNIVDGDVGKELLDKFEKKGIVGLRFWEIGFRQFSNNKVEVKDVEDVKGLKIRTLTSPVQVKVWEMYGALPTTIDSSEIYTSLQQGVIDGQENPISEIVSKRLYEVQKNVSLTSHVYTPMILGISKLTYDKLSEEQKDILEKAVIEATKASRAAVLKQEEEGLEILKQNGVKVVEDLDLLPFKEIGRKSYPIFTEKYGNEFIEKIEKAENLK